MVQPRESDVGRPVYILGAGFSHAVNDAMPLTDELGDAVTARLDLTWPKSAEKVSFEERLTLLSTPLPFLQGHENTSRRALAEQVTAALAQELDERNERAAADPAPLWLLQLVAIWHAQKAVVVTFNYDTLVERAVTELRPPVFSQRDYPPTGLHGWQVAFPSPSPVNARTIGDNEGPRIGSLQLLKLHGSLNWYWALGDGATLVRDAAMRGFGGAAPSIQDVAGVRLLDRFLVPPVTSKDSYYGVNLVHVLWRAASEAVRVAPEITILGYSMPPADRIAVELIRGAGQSPVNIVNWRLGSPRDSDYRTSPLGHASSLGLHIDGTWEGNEAVPVFVAELMQRAAISLASNAAIAGSPGATVVVSRGGSGDNEAMVLRDTEEGVVGSGFSWHGASNSDMPPYEFALNQTLRGLAKFEDFYTARRLREAVSGGAPFYFRSGDQTYQAVGAEAIAVGRWPAVHVLGAPVQP